MIQFYEHYFSAFTNSNMQTYPFYSFKVPKTSSQILTFSILLSFTVSLTIFSSEKKFAVLTLEPCNVLQKVFTSLKTDSFN